MSSTINGKPGRCRRGWLRSVRARVWLIGATVLMAAAVWAAPVSASGAVPSGSAFAWGYNGLRAAGRWLHD
jgi:hypothetical protein